MMADRHDGIDGIGRRIEHLHPHGRRVVRSAPESRANRWPMPTGFHPEATVHGGDVVDGEPEPDDVLTVGPQEGVVGVARHLATDVWLLEDVHRLQKLRILSPEPRKYSFAMCGLVPSVVKIVAFSGLSASCSASTTACGARHRR